MQADYINFVFEFPNFRYRGNRGWSEANYIVQLHSLTPEQPLGYLVKNRSRTHLLHKSRVMANFLLKCSNFRYHGNRGRLNKVSLTAVNWPILKIP